MAPLPTELVYRLPWQSYGNTSGTNLGLTLPTPPSGYWQINKIIACWSTSASASSVILAVSTPSSGSNIYDVLAIVPWTGVGSLEYTGPYYDTETESIEILLQGLNTPGSASLEVRYTLLGALLNL